MLHTLIKEVNQDYADYEPTAATRKLMSFVDEHLSNWYVRLNRRRFWKGEFSEDKRAAYQTLYECLLTVAKLSAPVGPFFSDWLYQKLNSVTSQEKHESVHLADFPESDANLIDPELEKRMDYAQRIASLVLSLRKKETIRVRQPLQKILLPVLDTGFQKRVDAVKDLILAEVNIKEIEYVTDTAGIIEKKAKPNFKTLGRRLGKDMKAAVQVINSLDQDAISKIEQTNSFSLEANGNTYELTLEDFEIVTEDIPGWQVASDGNVTVALDVSITPELEAEGMARDLVNRIQNIRKDKNFEVTDRIHVRLQEHQAVASAVQNYGSYIQEETLAETLELTAQVVDGTEIELPGELILSVSVELN